MGGVATVTLWIITNIYSKELNVGDNRWLSTTNVLVLLQSLSIFVLFNSMHLKKEYGWINTLSSNTWGIYLIHVFFID